MRKILVLLLATLLVGCGGPAGPDLGTPTGYREAMTERAERVAGAVHTAQARCATEPVERCRQALRDQGESFARVPAIETPLGGRPPECDALARDYFLLLEGGRDFFAQLNASIAQGDEAAVRRVARERLISFEVGWRAFNRTLDSGPCG